MSCFHINRIKYSRSCIEISLSDCYIKLSSINSCLPPIRFDNYGFSVDLNNTVADFIQSHYLHSTT